MSGPTKVTAEDTWNAGNHQVRFYRVPGYQGWGVFEKGDLIFYMDSFGFVLSPSDDPPYVVSAEIDKKINNYTIL